MEAPHRGNGCKAVLDDLAGVEQGEMPLRKGGRQPYRLIGALQDQGPGVGDGEIHSRHPR
ncbi:MAG: hypothetical protein P8Z70_06115 [Desulfuromonadales bacterium]